MHVFFLDKYGIGLRALEPEDAPLLAKWLSDPEVLRYYEGRDRPHDLELVRQHYYDEAGDTTACLLLYEEKPIGYLQFYPLSEENMEHYGLKDEEGATDKRQVYGMDQFIGETDCWNRGIGTEAIRLTVQYLIRERQARKIVMDPQAWNARALRVYEKVGFVKRRLLPKHEWHEGEYRDCWLIEYEAEEDDE